MDASQRHDGRVMDTPLTCYGSIMDAPCACYGGDSMEAPWARHNGAAPEAR